MKKSNVNQRRMHPHFYMNSFLIKVNQIMAFKSLFQVLKRGLAQVKPKQIIDSYWQVQKKTEELVHLIKQSKNIVVFTGAGISTSLGIPDYRSGVDTIVKTGPGLWNRQLNETKPHQLPIDKLVDIAKPSLSHMAIVGLLNKEIVKHVISQNTDGLHLRSGVPSDKISELHGNRNLQSCKGCGRKYNRDFRTLRRDDKKYYPGEKRDHSTGRACENCDGQLHDSIVYFGQKLPTSELETAYRNAHNADLCICIGSSLTVRPSATVPLQTLKRQPQGKICIINIQQTPLDQVAALRINYFCDDVMELLCKHLCVAIPKLAIKHYALLVVNESETSWTITIEGKDKNQNNLSFIKSAHIDLKGIKSMMKVSGHKCSIILKKDQFKLCKKISIEHYGQKPILSVDFTQMIPHGAGRKLFEYKMIDGQGWKVL